MSSERERDICGIVGYLTAIQLLLHAIVQKGEEVGFSDTFTNKAKAFNQDIDNMVLTFGETLNAN